MGAASEGFTDGGPPGTTKGKALWEQEGRGLNCREGESLWVGFRGPE